MGTHAKTAFLLSLTQLLTECEAWMLPGYSHFSFRLRGGYYPCAVVRWFNRVGNTLDDETDMWAIFYRVDGYVYFAVIHIESIFGTEPLPSR